MHNLKISWEVASRLQLQVGNGEEFLRSAAIDVERNRLFFASSANFIYETQILTPQIEGTQSKTSVPTFAKCIDLETGDFITCIEYVMEKEALIIGTSYGLLLLYTVDDDATEIVGQVEGGVKCISPSPDGDLFGMVTGFSQILVMNLDWDLLYEMPLDELSEDHVHESSSSTNFLYNSLLSWSGDGKFFSALSKVQNIFPSSKKLKVWEHDSGSLHSVSEPKPFMGSVVDWAQSGGKIAAVCDQSEKKQCPSVVLMERNGLERHSFSIGDGANATVKYLKFNCNSDLLAAIVRDETFDTVKIWYFSNNHWYLKQEIKYSRKDGVKFIWDPTQPLRLICWMLDGRIMSYKFVWVTAVMDNSIAFVIDGTRILVTPLSLSLIPPPMYFFSLEFPSPVSDMAYYFKISKNCLAVSLSNGSLSIVELPILDHWDELEGNNFKVEASYSETKFGSLLHLAWLDSHVLLSVCRFGFNHSNCIERTSFDESGLPSYCLVEIEVICSEDCIPGSITYSGWENKISNKIFLERVVIGIVPMSFPRYSAFVQFDGGELSEYISTTGFNREASLRKCDMSFLSSCPRMDIALVGNSELEKLLHFGLDDNGRLQIGGHILCNNCSSFSFYSNSSDLRITHVVMATKHDQLFIVDVADIMQGEFERKDEYIEPVVKGRKNDTESIYINLWEKGAQVVGVLHGDESAVILQTPRGNIECVYPRKLVLASIINALDEGRFRDALLMVRRHRIDFNVIVDRCGWQAFLQLAADFVIQVKNLSYITDFVCGLKNIDIIETMYKNYLSVPCIKDEKFIVSRDVKASNDHNKVNSILIAIRKALEENIEDSPSRELCILTTLAKNDPPALEEALGRVKVIREMELSRTDELRRVSCQSSEEALKHLLWLSDSEAVFEAALGLYDLNLAAIVALNSHKDPKEFLPLLEELEHMPVLLMKYNIDLKLRRHESALRHIFAAGEPYYEDFMNLMMNVPELYSLGLQLVVDPCKKRQVLEAWGDHLVSSKCFDDAATTYLCCFSLKKALKAYRGCGNWKGVLNVAGLIKLGKIELLQLARELCEELQALGKFWDAAKIILDYCGDLDNGISLLVRAREWEEALRISFLHKRDDLISVVRSSSLDCAGMLITEYNEATEKVGKYLTRYLGVRQRRLLLAETIQSDARSVGYLDDEIASQTSSNFSGMSAYTTGTNVGLSTSVCSRMSTKSRDRRRNRGKIRAGSPNEEMALVEHLKGLSLSEEAKYELKSLLTCLVMLGEEDTARKLQRSGEKFQVSETAALKLTEDAMPSDSINEHIFSLDRYIQKLREEPLPTSEAFFWLLKILL